MALRGFRTRGTWLLAGANRSARPRKCSGAIGRTPPPSTPSTPNRHANLEGHTLPTSYKGTEIHSSLFFPLTTTLFGVEHHRVCIPVDVVDHRHVEDLKDLPQWGHASQTGFISVH